jgi:hypothetical protein
MNPIVDPAIPNRRIGIADAGIRYARPMAAGGFLLTFDERPDRPVTRRGT